MAADRSPPDAWLALSLVPELTGTAWRRLLGRFGSAERILAQPAPVLEGAVGAETARAIVRGPERARLDAALAWSRQPDCSILAQDDPRFPRLLLETASAPLVLYARGRLDLLQRASLAVVGSRNATPQGRRNASDFARAAARSGLCVVSGLAAGIDAAAHEAALHETGSTVAVLGSGADIVYPRINERLFDEICGSGLVLSEFPLGTPPTAKNFPRRNRIISGLCTGCLVVEAAMASGSLITARLAAEMGRDVFAIPGSIHSPMSRGCHYLIKQGAKLVETPDEVLEEFGVASAPAPERTTASARPGSPMALVVEAMGFESCSVDALIERTAMDAEELLPVLVELELDGRIARLSDGTYQRVK